MIEHFPLTVDVKKPWGKFEQYTHNAVSTVKIITVRPGGILSLQYHHRRDELWVVLDPGARVEVGGRVLHPQKGEKVFIPRMEEHRLSSASVEPVRILEISFGEFDEDDIVRLEDAYGRVPPQNESRSVR
jgi:mannose-6-phosphate isomerase